jgi:hypothetical protein
MNVAAGSTALQDCRGAALLGKRVPQTADNEAARAFPPPVAIRSAYSPSGGPQDRFNAQGRRLKGACAWKASAQASRNNIAHVGGELAPARYIVKRLLRPGLSLRLQGAP